MNKFGWFKRSGVYVLAMLFVGSLTSCAAYSSEMVLENEVGMPAHLGVHEGKLAPMPFSPNAVSSQAVGSSKFVEPLPMKGSVDETRTRILATLKLMEGNVVTYSEDTYIHAVFVSRIFGFRDDVEFYIDVPAGVVHFRSASRIGFSDFGANNRRYVRFKRMYLE